MGSELACRTASRSGADHPRFWLDNLFDAWQMFGQGTPVCVPRLRFAFRRFNLLILGMHRRDSGLDILERQLIPVMISLLGLCGEQCPFEVSNQRLQPDDPASLRSIMASHSATRASGAHKSACNVAISVRRSAGKSMTAQ